MLCVSWHRAAGLSFHPNAALEPLFDLEGHRAADDLSVRDILDNAAPLVLAPRPGADKECDVDLVLAPATHYRRIRLLKGGRMDDASGSLSFAYFYYDSLKTLFGHKSVASNHGFWVVVHFLRTCMRSADPNVSWVNDSLRAFFAGALLCVRSCFVLLR